MNENLNLETENNVIISSEKEKRSSYVPLIIIFAIIIGLITFLILKMPDREYKEFKIENDTVFAPHYLDEFYAPTKTKSCGKECVLITYEIDNTLTLEQLNEMITVYNKTLTEHEYQMIDLDIKYDSDNPNDAKTMIVYAKNSSKKGKYINIKISSDNKKVEIEFTIKSGDLEKILEEIQNEKGEAQQNKNKDYGTLSGTFSTTSGCSSNIKTKTLEFDGEGSFTYSEEPCEATGTFSSSSGSYYYENGLYLLFGYDFEEVVMVFDENTIDMNNQLYARQ